MPLASGQRRRTAGRGFLSLSHRTVSPQPQDVSGKRPEALKTKKNAHVACVAPQQRFPGDITWLLSVALPEVFLPATAMLPHLTTLVSHQGHLADG